jgi:hypothetical protein
VLTAATPAPMPTATPLKTISHQHVTALCSGLSRVIKPAIGTVLRNDQIIAQSKPYFHDYVKAAAQGADYKASQDMAVTRLEMLITPLVKNTEAIDRLLNNPYVFPRNPKTEDDQRLLQLRRQLLAVDEQQKRALDVISGFVSTQQLGELQAEGHEYDSAINPPSTPGPDSVMPTTAPNDVMNAGVNNNNNDPSRKYDPRYNSLTGSMVGSNSLDAFSDAIAQYQKQIADKEQTAADSVMQALPRCK